jgi:hypothetical protein
MAAGMQYDLNPQENERELWSQETTYRYIGGFNLNDSDIPDGAKLPPLAPLAIDFTTRKAKVCKTAKVVEAAAAGATTLKVAKGSFIIVGTVLGTGAASSAGAGTVSAIDKSNTGYDLLTVSATTATLAVGDVIIETSAAGGTTPKNVANALNYSWVKQEAGATLAAVGQAYEIKLSKLYLPLGSKEQASLKAQGNYIFIV